MQALRDSLSPVRNLIHELVESVHANCVDDRSGEILRGIPALEEVEPDSFGICLATADGYVYEVGDTRLEFCIQSISKPFIYGIALADRGVEAVDAKVDIEPSGELYNEISLHPVTHRPRNPMINAGALVAASLVAGADPEEQVERIGRTYSTYAGRVLALEEEVYRSQVEFGHRNLAIGHLLREFGILEDDPSIPHEVYLRACSTMVTCRDLSLMGATWANDGVQPLTGERLLSVELTERVLSVMSTCGMYDAAGAWFAEVGMAAKSGVGGGIVAVLPGQLAIAAFSPRLDQHGNSVRAVKACRQLSRDLELHSLHSAHEARSAIRDSYDILEAPSSLKRPEADRLVLEEHGRKARIYELHGDLLFAGAESVVRELCASGEGLEFIVLDVRGVSDVAQVSLRLLAALRGWLREQDCEGMLIDPDGLLPDARAGNGTTPTFATIAEATVYLEDRLLERYGDPHPAEEEFRFEDHAALAGVPEWVIDQIRGRLRPRSYVDGELIVAEGDAEAGVFTILEGRARASLVTASGGTRSLGTLTPGTSFGAVYVVTGNPHPLTMHAQGRVEAVELTREDFAEITEQDAELRAAILKIFMYEIRDDLDRSLRALATGRVAPMTAT